MVDWHCIQNKEKTVTNNDDFGKWLLDELERRSMSQADLARKSGVSRTAISDVISGSSKPGFRLCRGIADGLRLPFLTVLLQAGLVRESDIFMLDGLSSDERSLLHGFRMLVPDDKISILRIVDSLVLSQSKDRH